MQPDLRKWEIDKIEQMTTSHTDAKAICDCYNDLIDYALAEKQRADEADKPFWNPINEGLMDKQKVQDGRKVLLLTVDKIIHLAWWEVMWTDSQTLEWIYPISITHFAEIPARPKEGK